MRILLITAEEWNDYVYGNNVLTNWFKGFPAEFAQIYVSPGLPNNHICKKYFQITDAQMARSIVGGSKAGKEIQMYTDTKQLETTKINASRKGLYGFMKKFSTWCRTPVVDLQDVIWAAGRFDVDSMSKFIEDFNPDIVFSIRMLNYRLIRLERLVSTMTDAPFVAFTADDEASYQQYDLSPLYWIRRCRMHRQFKNHVVGFYKHYWMFSEDQAIEYAREYSADTSTLYKCGDFPYSHTVKPVGKPIRMVYAGRLYCNRWKTLAEIGKALKEINRNDEKMVLDIYTTEDLTREQKKFLGSENSVFVHGRVSPSELVEIYHKADIALHVESFDKKYKLATRVSFSTKIIDLMASTCAILAVCWEQHAGYKYLKEQDAAFCVADYKDVLPLLKRICKNPDLIQQYARKAYDCGQQNHNREKIQRQMSDLFERVIEENKKNN